MSLISVSSSSQVSNELYSLSTPAPSAAAVSVSATPPPPAESSAELAAKKLAADLATLLKELSSGDIAGAKAAVAALTSDLKSQLSTRSGDATSAEGTAAKKESPLDALITRISTSLASGDTSSALSSVADYILQSGSSTGNQLNVTA